MSKIGRKAIPLGGVNVDIKGQTVHYKGSKSEGSYVLPDFLEATQQDGMLKLNLRNKFREANVQWGMHRALLANKIIGADKGFEKKVTIVGLGYKAKISGKIVELALGYSHKISFDLPEQVTLEVDKSGQNLLFRSSDKEKLGLICDKVRSFRPPEPYKGTGVKLADEVIARKAGKAKSAA